MDWPTPPEDDFEGQPLTQAGDRPPGPGRLTKAAMEGDELALLRGVRDQIAMALDQGVPSRELATLTKRLSEVMADIKKLEAERKEGGDDIGGAAATPDEAFPASA